MANQTKLTFFSTSYLIKLNLLLYFVFKHTFIGLLDMFILKILLLYVDVAFLSP